MRSIDSLIRGIAAGGLAAAALVAITSISEAGFRGGGFGGGGFRGMSMGSMGSRGPMMSRGHQGGFQKFNNSAGTPAGSLNKGPKLTTKGPGHDGGRKPPGRRPPHGKHPPGFGPVLGPIGPIGPIVGTGTAIGTLGPAIAGTPAAQNFSGPPGGRGGINVPPANERRFVEDEVVLEFANNLATQGVAQLLARYGLLQLEAQRFTLSNSTLIRARIIGSRSVRATLARLGGEAILRTGQPNFYYQTAQSSGANPIDPAALPKPAVATAGARPAGGDPAQYALRKLRLNEAHEFSTGDKILVAVIDSGIDLSHPELRGMIAGSYDALGQREAPHKHGTGIAGVIAAHGRLLGAAPEARILAIRAFGAHGTRAEATSFAILKGIEYAATHGARVVNMSFAGPHDPALSRQLAGARERGVVLIAASGNLGPLTGPQYPAADPNVIAVSATDASDKTFKAANIGPHIAVTAPGVDILVPAPDSNYQVVSGTSFAAAYVSGVAALVLERAPGLKPDAVRRILQSTAKDLGPRGKDNETGAGLVDAYQAVTAVQANATAGIGDLPSKSLVK